MPLAYDSHGSGTPIVLLHGLTFDRTSWRPIVDRLGDDVHTIAIDLPAHGESGGAPAYLDVVAAQVHELVEQLGIEPPVVVGHSISGAIAMIYAAAYPTRGAVDIDNPFDIRPFAKLVQQIAPALRGDAFERAFAPIQQSMRLDLLPEPIAQAIDQDVVLGYWDELIRADPEKFQQRIETIARGVTVPGLALFGSALTAEQRAYMRAIAPTVEVEEWPGHGHMLHLVEPDRFTDRLRSFVASATPVGAL
jgi:pimeloyl-ACP methyl ester carboxylesterase